MLKNNDINIYANNVTEQVIKSSKIHIPNKFIKVKQSDPHWMNNNIKQMMRKRKRLYGKYRIRGNFRGFKFSRFWVKNMHINFRGF